MAFVFIDPRRHSTRKRRIKKNAESQRVLDALDAYLEGNYQEPMKWLVRFWRDQATVLTYQELRRIVTDEKEPDRLFDSWYQDYSKFLNEKMTPAWESAFRAGAASNPALDGVQIDNSDVFVRDWLTNHTGNLITSVTEDQVNAVRYIVAESKAVRMGSDETARYIRPIVGLTERQAQANLKHYTTVKEKLQEDHPRMRPENIERKARESAAKYAQKQQMYRAETISRTEIAQAYNQGNDTLIKQAMEQGLIPIQKKVWSTAMDGHVCEACESLEGTEIEMDGQFSATIGVRVKRTLTTALPPMHPRCKCAVMYESTGEYMTPREDFNPESGEDMMASVKPNDWSDTYPRDVSKEEKKELIEYAKQNGVNAIDFSKFDGDKELMKSQIDTLSRLTKEFPVGKTVSITVGKLSGEDFGETRNRTVILNSVALRDANVTRRNILLDGQFASINAQDTVAHEYGHVFANTLNIKGLDIARQGYYNAYKENISDEKLREFLFDNLSEYSIKRKGTEIIPELFAKHNSNADAFTSACMELLKGVAKK